MAKVDCRSGPKRGLPDADDASSSSRTPAADTTAETSSASPTRTALGLCRCRSACSRARSLRPQLAAQGRSTPREQWAFNARQAPAGP